MKLYQLPLFLPAVLFTALFSSASGKTLQELDSLLEHRIFEETAVLQGSLDKIPNSRIGDRLTLGVQAGMGASSDTLIRRTAGTYAFETIRADFQLIPNRKRYSKEIYDSLDIVVKTEQLRRDLLLRLYDAAVRFSSNRDRRDLLDSCLRIEKQRLELTSLREKEGFLLSRDQEEFDAVFLQFRRDREYAEHAQSEAAEQIRLLCGEDVSLHDSLDIALLDAPLSKTFHSDTVWFQSEKYRISERDTRSPVTVSVGAALSASHWFQGGVPGINGVGTCNLIYYPGMRSELKKSERTTEFERALISIEEKRMRGSSDLIRSELKRGLADRASAVRFASEYALRQKDALVQARLRSGALIGDQKEQELKAEIAWYKAKLEECDALEKLNTVRARAALFAPELMNRRTESHTRAGRTVLVWNQNELRDSVCIRAVKTYGITGAAVSFSAEEIQLLRRKGGAESAVMLADSLIKSGISVSILIGEPQLLLDTLSLQSIIQTAAAVPHSSVILDLEPSQLNPVPSDSAAREILIRALRTAVRCSEKPIIPLIHSSLFTRSFTDELYSAGIAEAGAMIYRPTPAAAAEETARVLSECASLSLYTVISAEPAEIIGEKRALRDLGISGIFETLNAVDSLTAVNPQLRGSMIHSLHYLSEVQK